MLFSIFDSLAERFLKTTAHFLGTFKGLIGFLIGSFLSVVVTWLPILFAIVFGPQMLFPQQKFGSMERSG